MAGLTKTDGVQTENIGEILRGKIIQQVRRGSPPELAARSMGVDEKTLKWWKKHLPGFKKELQAAIDAAGSR